ADDEVRGIELAELEAQRLEPIAAGALVAGGTLESFGDRAVALPRRGGASAQRLGLGATAPVEPAALQLGVGEPELVTLAVDGEQVRREVGKQAHGGRLVVDEDAVAAFARHLATHHQLRARGLDAGVGEHTPPRLARWREAA